MDSTGCLDACVYDASCVSACVDSSSSTAVQPLPVVMSVVLLFFSAFFSGLTLGLLSLDVSGLELIIAGIAERAC